MNLNYEIAHYAPEHEAPVLDLLQHLWRHTADNRRRLFHWKYAENPHADRPLGIVALQAGRVVGFRGYFADRFELAGRSDDIGVLHPGDTCVDPAHRNRGLSVAMGERAAEFDGSRYRLLMNTTCSAQSLPGYLKLGFAPLTTKTRLTQYGRNPLRWIRSGRSAAARPLAASGIELGRTGDLLVSGSPRPADMAAVIGAEKHARAALALNQDEAYFAWRFRNPVRKYVFYFLLDRDATRSYLVMSVSPDGQRGEIVDYGARDPGALSELLAHIDRRKDFASLSILSYGADERLLPVLVKLGFRATHPLSRWLPHTKASKPALPILIRPIARSFTEEPFLIEGLDVRGFENWRLKPICSDAA